MPTKVDSSPRGVVGRAGAPYRPPMDAAPHRRSRRDWIVDAATFVAAVAGGLGILASTDHPGGMWLAADLALGAAVCTSLWWRRRYPLALAVAAAPIASVAVSPSIASAILLFSLAVHRPARQAIPVGALHASGVFVYAALYPDPREGYWMSIVFGWLVAGVLVGWGMWVRARRELVAELRDRVERAETEQALRVDRARLGERERIAREMHDVLAHRLSLLSLHAGALEYRPDAPRADVARAAGVIRDNAHRALEELRAVIGALRDDEGADPEPPQPTLTDLPRLVQESVDAGMRVTPEFPVGDLAAPPDDVGRHAYRVAQEGLTNARKHAPRSAVALTVDGGPGEGLRVEVRNALPADRAAAEIPGAGAGLAGLDERVALAGGRVEHGRTADGDYRLAAWLPWGA